MHLIEKFKFTVLYLMTHNITGKMYFGKSHKYTTIPGLMKYKGSGTYWRNHLKKHGDDISVQIMFSSNVKEDVIEYAMNYSVSNKIVESNIYANLKNEDGLEGGNITEEMKRKISKTQTGKIASEETRKKMSLSHLGSVMPPRSDEYKKKMSISKTGTILSDAHKESISVSMTKFCSSEEAREAKSKRQTGTKRPESTKKKISIAAQGKVCVYNKETGEKMHTTLEEYKRNELLIHVNSKEYKEKYKDEL